MGLNVELIFTDAARASITTGISVGSASVPIGWPMPTVGDHVELTTNAAPLRFKVMHRLLELGDDGRIRLTLDLPDQK